MTPQQLRRRIKRLDPMKPMHKELEQALREGVGFNKAWYSSQKEHWLGWLAEYNGPGAYGRQTGTARDARYIYAHIQCAPMLFWLAEALDVDDGTLEAAFRAVVAAPKRNASQCAALRGVIPWDALEPKLEELARQHPLSRTMNVLKSWTEQS